MADAKGKKPMAAATSSVNSSNRNTMQIRVVSPGQRNSGDLQSAFLVINHSNFRKSVEPSRLMFFDVDGMWGSYPEEVLNLAKCRFRDRIPTVEVSVSDRNVLLDFFRMLEVDFESGFERSIAWIDMRGRCFFPKTFVNSGRDLGVRFDKIKDFSVNVKLVNDDEEVTSKRKREGDEVDVEVDQDVKVGDDDVHVGEGEGPSNVRVPVPIPANIRDEVVVHGVLPVIPRWEGTRKLAEDVDRGYNVTKRLFLGGLGALGREAVTVTAVHHCLRNDPESGARFDAFSRLIEAMASKRGSANVSFAWYGTSAASVNRLVAHGRLQPEDVNKNSPRGVGAYLTPAIFSRYSTLFAERDEGGEKHVVLCRVILGASERLIDRSQVFPSSPAYDTGMDDLRNPKWYVVWPSDMNTHILPEVVLSFRGPPEIFPDVARGPAFMPAATFGIYAMVVSKVGKTIAAGPARELQLLFGLWKDGKIQEDMFTQRLGALVGEERLRDMIDEIQRARAAE